MLFKKLIPHLSFIWHPKNFLLCLKYPFLKRRNIWSDTFLGYKYTLYDDIPIGWQIAFGKNLLKELKAAFINRREMKRFRFTQIKEKYGYLCLYYFRGSEKVEEVLHKYENISYKYCIGCGKPTEYATKGWIYYLCKDCYIKVLKEQEKLNQEQIAKRLIEDKLNKEEK